MKIKGLNRKILNIKAPNGNIHWNFTLWEQVMLVLLAQLQYWKEAFILIH